LSELSLVHFEVTPDFPERFASDVHAANLQRTAQMSIKMQIGKHSYLTFDQELLNSVHRATKPPPTLPSPIWRTGVTGEAEAKAPEHLAAIQREGRHERLADMTHRYWDTDKQMWMYPESEKRIAEAIALLKVMTDDERLECFAAFCKFCGSDDPDCVCWNDE
jgi:hypothetical protein